MLWALILSGSILIANYDTKQDCESAFNEIQRMDQPIHWCVPYHRDARIYVGK